MITKTPLLARITSLFLIVMFAFTMLPAGLAFAEADYEFVITADKAKVAAGETVTLDITVNGAMANLSMVQYSLQYDPAKLAVDTSAAKAPFDTTWYKTLRKLNADTEEYDYYSLGQISMPSSGAKADPDDSTKSLFSVAFFDTAGSYITEGMDIYNDTTVVAGKIIFTAAADITDIANEIVLTNTAIQVKTTASVENKTTEVVQLVATSTDDGSDDGSDDTSDTYEFVITADKAKVAAGETVTLDITVNGAMANLSMVQYSLQYDPAKLAVDTSAAKAPFDTTWYKTLRKLNADTEEYDYYSLGQISMPSSGVKADPDDSTKSLFSVAFFDTAGSYITEGMDIYNDTTVVAGKIIFTAAADITDIANEIVLTNTAIQVKTATSVENKETTVVQLVATPPVEPEVDTKVQAAIDAIAAIGTVEYTDESKALIDAARAAYDAVDADKITEVTNADVLTAAEARYAELKAAADKIAADQAAAAEVDALIEEIGEVTLNSVDAIAAARAAYDALEDDQEQYVTKLDTLVAAEAALKALEDAQQPSTPGGAGETYEFVITADKSAVAAGGTVTLDITVNGSMANLSMVQYSLQYDPAKLAVDTSAAKAPFDTTWYKTLRKLNADTEEYDYYSLGQISMPSSGVKADPDDSTKSLFSVAFFDTAGSYITEGMDIYNDTTVVAGKVVFTAGADITDIANEIVLTNTAIQVKTATSVENKETTVVQLVAAPPVEPEVDTKVQAAIDAIAAIGTVEYTDESKALIDVARAAYDAVDADKIAEVTNADVLTAAEARYAELKAAADKIAADKEAAAKVDALIEEIGTVTLNSADAIAAARTAYDALEDDQEQYVTKYDTLVAAEADYAQLVKNAENEALAAEVADAINAIPAVTLNNVEDAEKAITSARTKYDALVAAGIGGLVDSGTVGKLTLAEQNLANAKQTLADIDAVEAKIDAIGTVTEDSLNAIEDAESAYDALTSDEAKALVENHQTLLDARAAYDAIVEDNAAVKAVIDEIDEVVSEVITLDSGDAIDAAYESFNALRDDLKSKVTNKTDLDDAKATYDALVEREEKINAVEELIDAIGEVTSESGAAIVEAENAYAALDEDAQAEVENYQTLVDARIAYDDIMAQLGQEEADRKKAEAVDSMIDAIGEVTLESEGKITRAEAAYEALTPAQKNYVKNYKVLERAREEYDILVANKNAVDNVIALIEAIGEVKYPDSYDAIKAARVALDELDDTLALDVTNIDVLTKAEDAYEILETEYLAKKEVIEAIEAIGEVEYTADSLALIVAAEEAYANLDDTLKLDIADYYHILKEARAAYDALKPVVSVPEAPVESYGEQYVMIITNVEAGKKVSVEVAGEIIVASQVVIGDDVYYILLSDVALTNVEPIVEAVPAAETVPSLLLGDVNADGDIDAGDALLANRYAVGDVADIYLTDKYAVVRTDVTGEAEFTAFDAWMIAMHDAYPTEGWDAKFKLNMSLAQ